MLNFKLNGKLKILLWKLPVQTVQADCFSGEKANR